MGEERAEESQRRRHIARPGSSHGSYIKSLLIVANVRRQASDASWWTVKLGVSTANTEKTGVVLRGNVVSWQHFQRRPGHFIVAIFSKLMC